MIYLLVGWSINSSLGMMPRERNIHPPYYWVRKPSLPGPRSETSFSHSIKWLAESRSSSPPKPPESVLRWAPLLKWDTPTVELVATRFGTLTNSRFPKGDLDKAYRDVEVAHEVVSIFSFSSPAARQNCCVLWLIHCFQFPGQEKGWAARLLFSFVALPGYNPKSKSIRNRLWRISGVITGFPSCMCSRHREVVIDLPALLAKSKRGLIE